MSALPSALALAGRGFAVFPCLPSKAPACPRRRRSSRSRSRRGRGAIAQSWHARTRQGGQSPARDRGRAAEGRGEVQLSLQLQRYSGGNCPHAGGADCQARNSVVEGRSRAWGNSAIASCVNFSKRSRSARVGLLTVVLTCRLDMMTAAPVPLMIKHGRANDEDGCGVSGPARHRHNCTARGSAPRVRV